MRHAQGPLLTIDLTERTASTTAIDDRLAEFVGGRGLNTSLAYDRIPFDADPLGPENRLYFSTGPMQYSTTSYTGRMAATGLSPLTNGLVSSNAGGFLSRNVTGAGYAAVEIVGTSDDLLAVHIREIGDDGSPTVEFEAVPDLAEAEVSAVSDRFAESHDLEPEHVACVGPAGENGVRFASIMTSDTRAFGRGGLGAALGGKGVKALTFAGDATVELDLDWPDDAGEVHREAATSDSIMKRQGTASVTELANEVDALPPTTSRRPPSRARRGSPATASRRRSTRRAPARSARSPASSPLATRRPASRRRAGVRDRDGVRSNAGVDDIVDVMAANELCDELGMDTISCGDVVSMFLESEDEFGNADLVRSLVEQIAYREGVGDKLAEGVHRACEEFGAEDWTVKGMAFSGHDGRKLNGQGLGFATSNRGADHMYGEFYPYEYPLVDKDQALDPSGLEGKPPKLVAKENRNAVLDSAVVCKFSRGVVTDDRLATLLDAEYDELLDIGARVVELERAFNNARGFDRADDTVPYADAIDGFDEGLSEYYAIRGWNDDGTVPGYDEVDPVSADD